MNMSSTLHPKLRTRLCFSSPESLWCLEGWPDDSVRVVNETTSWVLFTIMAFCSDYIHQSNALEHIQKRALGIILRHQYESYDNDLQVLTRQTLQICNMAQLIDDSKSACDRFPQWWLPPKQSERQQLRHRDRDREIICRTKRCQLKFIAFSCQTSEWLVRTIFVHSHCFVW